jgi:hypothetical protein
MMMLELFLNQLNKKKSYINLQFFFFYMRESLYQKIEIIFFLNKNSITLEVQQLVEKKKYTGLEILVLKMIKKKVI